MEINKDFEKDKILEYLSKKKYRGQEIYLNGTLEYVCDNLSEIDALIDSHSTKWKTSRMPRLDLTILRLAIAESKVCDDIPIAVTINEAIKLAKIYGEEDSYSFINAVLGKILNEK